MASKKKKANPMPPLYQIQAPDGNWLKVTEDIFRSWTGNRRYLGKDYHGDVFYLWSDRIAKKGTE